MAASGIGGGGFAIVHLANGTTRSFNFREMAPQASHPDMFVGKYRSLTLLSTLLPGGKIFY